MFLLILLKRPLRYLDIQLSKLKIIFNFLFFLLKTISYYIFLIFIYNFIVDYFYYLVSKLNKYLIRNHHKFFIFLAKKFNKVKLIMYGTSDVYPQLTGYRSFILLVKGLFYSFNIPLILLSQQSLEHFF